MSEFRPTMQERKKWAEHAKNLRVGDLVVLADPNNPRGHWPLGRILKTLEATDGVVRSAIVKIGSSEIHRPATKIYPLDVEYRVRNAHRAGDVPDGTSLPLSLDCGFVSHFFRLFLLFFLSTTKMFANVVSFLPPIVLFHPAI